jgi:hypothetical protein
MSIWKIIPEKPINKQAWGHDVRNHISRGSENRVEFQQIHLIYRLSFYIQILAASSFCSHKGVKLPVFCYFNCWKHMVPCKI